MDYDDTNEESKLLPGVTGSSRYSSSADSQKNGISLISKLFCCRNVLVFLQFCGFVTVYGMRANLSVALVAMVNQTYAEKVSDKIVKPECRRYHGNMTDDYDNEDGPFNWDQKLQGYILSAFFYGYIATQIPGGWLANRYGGKKVLAFGIFFTALFTGLTPMAARTNALFLIAVRVLAGFSEGVTYPAATIMWSRWAPPLERSSFITLCFTGGDFGAIAALPLSGWLSSLTFLDDGWPMAFYVFGALGILWFIAWLALIHESPALHPRISQWEKQHILSGIGHSQDKTAKKLPTPWMSIFTSVPVWAMFITAFSYGWGWYVFLTCLPSYFKEVLDFDIKENGALTALPFIASFVSKNCCAQLSDWLQRRFGWSTTCVRKAFGCTGLLLSAGLLIPVGFLNCDQTSLSVLLLTLSCGGLGVYAPTGGTIPLDLAPRFSGVVMATINLGTNIPGVLTPLVVGHLTNHNPTREQWKKAFYITCSLYLFGILVFLIFGSAKEQPWNNLSTKDVEEEDDEKIINSVLGRKEVLPDINPTSNHTPKEQQFVSSTSSTASAVI